MSDIAHPKPAPAPLMARWAAKLFAILPILPGLLLAAAVAWLGIWASEWIGKALLGFEKSPISGIMMAIIFGMVISNTVAVPARFQLGIRFSLKNILKLGIILLGIRLSLGDVLRLGALGIPLVAVCIVGAILFAQWLGRRLRLSPTMSTLIAVGSSICGATAIVATGPAIDAKEEEITYAVANITLFGVLAMFFYPVLAHGLFADELTSAGLFLGTAIHETAQVAGGGLIYDQLYDVDKTLEVATVTKLVRNVSIAFVIPLMAYWHKRQTGHGHKNAGFLSLFPLFILGFLLVAFFRTVGDASLSESGRAWWLLIEADWDGLTTTIRSWAEICLAVAMAAVGLGTTFKQLRGLGLKPFYVGLGASLAVGVISLVGIAVLQALNLT